MNNIMATRLKVRWVGHGYYEVVVEQDNFQKKRPYRQTSISRWECIITDSISYNDYMSDDEHRFKRGKKNLIRQCKSKSKCENIRL